MNAIRYIFSLLSLFVALSCTSGARNGFPDISDVEYSDDSGLSFVSIESDDTINNVVLHYKSEFLPTAFLQVAVRYINSSLVADSVMASLSCNVRADVEYGVLQLQIFGDAETMLKDTEQVISAIKRVADGDKLHEYLIANDKEVRAAKRDMLNVVRQASRYLNGENSLRGLRSMALYCMEILRSMPSDVLYCGDERDRMSALFCTLPKFTSTVYVKNSATSNDKEARLYLLPSDIVNIAVIAVAEASDGADEYAVAALFNRASEISTGGKAAISGGTILYESTADSLYCEPRVPFSIEAFEAAKASFLHELTARSSDIFVQPKEYIFVRDHGYGTAEIYDAVMALEFSDMENLFLDDFDDSEVCILVGRESDMDLRTLTERGGVVHLTYDEFFGF